MKSLVFNLLLLFLTTNWLIGQLATERNYCEINGFNGINTVIRNTFLKDSLVEGKRCSVFKINKAINSLSSRWEYTTQIDLIAEEGDSLFVWDDDKWILDQDYSRNAGDTMIIDYYLNTYLDSSEFEEFYFIIDSVYQQEYFGTLRTIQEVHSFMKLKNNAEKFSRKIINIKGIGSFLPIENLAIEDYRFVPDRMAFYLPCELVPAHCGQSFNLCNVSWADEIYELNNLCDSLLSTSIFDQSTTITSILSNTLVESELYLNPEVRQVGTLAIYDMGGRLIASVPTKTSVVDVSNIKPGIYILLFRDDSGFIKAEKFLKLPNK
ncbi:MAG: T9SS type A sorting domain-containing protein [Saprospiraceae bacterium]|nr:T9SS type A sorting domain-containing protein [Saprospiraceae bacterium]